MSRDTVLARGRAALTASLTDACTIQHPTGLSAPSAAGVVTPTYSLLYTGPCKVKGADSASGQDVAGAHLAVLSPEVHVPVDVVGVEEGDVITITASRYDPELVGRVFRTDGPQHKSHATARRLPCKEITS